MKRYLYIVLAAFLLGCGNRGEQFVMPGQVTDFTALYKNNCAGCHGPDGHSGAARPLSDPAFLAVIGKEKLRNVIANGVPKTAMPAFAQSAGGGLTNQQIAILADQMEDRWSRPQDFDSIDLPPYSADQGDPRAGEIVFHTYCGSCHGEEGAGGSKAGSVIDPSFLALVSNQSIRSSVIAGRPDQGAPDWRGDSPGHPITPQGISDVVAWIAEHRAPINVSQRGTKLP
jgi:cytochrome c oxidase cbb3-type subunit 3